MHREKDLTRTSSKPGRAGVEFCHMSSVCSDKNGEHGERSSVVERHDVILI